MNCGGMRGRAACCDPEKYTFSQPELTDACWGEAHNTLYGRMIKAEVSSSASQIFAISRNTSRPPISCDELCTCAESECD